MRLSAHFERGVSAGCWTRVSNLAAAQDPPVVVTRVGRQITAVVPTHSYLGWFAPKVGTKVEIPAAVPTPPVPAPAAVVPGIATATPPVPAPAPVVWHPFWHKVLQHLRAGVKRP
jgi:hypothetical protein